MKTLGKQSEAVAAYRTAFELRPSFGDAYWSLANLKTYRFAGEDIARMREQERVPDIDGADRYHLCFALGKALEDRGDYAESFGYYRRGNALKKAELRFKIEPIERNARLQAAVCTREFFEARRGYGCDSDEPIFIVGLPRSGSTLLEQILASHSQVEGTTELPNILRFVAELQGRDPDTHEPRYPAILERLTAADFTQARREIPRRYPRLPHRQAAIHRQDAEQLQTHRAHSPDSAECQDHRCAARADGVLLQQFQAAVRIRAGVHLRHRGYRPLLSQLCAADAPLGRRLAGQGACGFSTRMSWKTWKPTFAAFSIFADLPFEPACLDFHKTERSVRTASSEQVRRPIFKEGLDQWRHFEPWLGSLRSALGDLVPATEECAEVSAM